MLALSKSNHLLTAHVDFDHIEYASFAVGMVKIEYIAWEMNHLNHYRYCLAEPDLVIVIDLIPSY